MKITTNIGLITVCWIMFWLTLACVNIENMDGVSIYECVYVVLFCAMFYLSFYFVLNKVRVSTSKNPKFSYSLFKLFCVVVFIIYLPIMYRSITFIFSMNPWEYRSKAFGNDNEASLLFGSQVIRVLYSFLIEGAVFFIQYLSLAYYVLYSRKKFLLLGVLFSFIVSVVMLGRSPFYYYILMSIIAMLLANKNRLSIKSLLFVFLSIITLYLISYFRSGGSVDIIYFFNRYFLGYHLYGFNLLNKSIDFSQLFDNEIWYGQATLGSFSYFILYPLGKIFGSSIIYYNSDYYTMKQAFVLLNNGDSANAFYTIFYDMYMDFGSIGCIIFGLFLGGVYGYIYKKNIKNPNNIYFLSLYFFFLNISFGMIFRNPFATNGFVGFCFYLVLFYLLSHTRVRK